VIPHIKEQANMDAVVPTRPLTQRELEVYMTIAHEGMNAIEVFSAQLRAMEIIAKSEASCNVAHKPEAVCEDSSPHSQAA
jgi:hypothetical protein